MSGSLHVLFPASPRRLLIALVVLLLPLAGAATARADEGVGGRCEGRIIEQPFVTWDDLADYFLAPDGDFSDGALGWALDGGAQVVEDNEPWNVHGSPTAAAVEMESGASATSPTICVAETDPTMRFFARSTGDPAGTLQVEVLYADAEGEHALTIGTLDAASTPDWTPTPALPIGVNIYEMGVSFRFSAVGTGSTWRIDDLFVDPYRKGRPAA